MSLWDPVGCHDPGASPAERRGRRRKGAANGQRLGQGPSAGGLVQHRGSHPGGVKAVKGSRPGVEI